jgi:NADH-quinone oxidoreductase subunit E
MEKTVDLSLISGVLDELADVKGSLITILQKTQDIYGYLPKEAIIEISKRTGIAESEIMGVATFYTQFSPPPSQVSHYALQGTACTLNQAS